MFDIAVKLIHRNQEGMYWYMTLYTTSYHTTSDNGTHGDRSNRRLIDIRQGYKEVPVGLYCPGTSCVLVVIVGVTTLMGDTCNSCEVFR